MKTPEKVELKGFIFNDKPKSASQALPPQTDTDIPKQVTVNGVDLDDIMKMASGAAAAVGRRAKTWIPPR